MRAMTMRQSTFLIYSVLFSALLSLVFPVSASAATEFKFGGFVKAAVIGSDRSVSTFGNDNLAAPTAARPKGLAVAGSQTNDNGLVSFQTAQSRINMSGEVDKTAKAVLEFDFFDSGKSSPTVAQIPRVRIAKIEYRSNETTVLSAGQDWDVFAPINVYSYNYVGNNFQAGNAGFMRQQAVLSHLSDDVELRYAVGMLASNGTVTVTDAEHTNYPSLAFSAAIGKANDRFGLSALVGRLVLTSGPNGDNRTDRDVYGVTLFAEKPLGAVAIRSEFYYGQNLENTGALSLSRATIANSFREYGGFVSAKYGLTETSSLFATVGFAQMVNSDDIVPLVATAATNGPILGMKGNMAAKLGYDCKFSEKLTAFGEVSRLESNYAGLGAATSYVGELGLLLQL